MLSGAHQLHGNGPHFDVDLFRAAVVIVKFADNIDPNKLDFAEDVGFHVPVSV